MTEMATTFVFMFFIICIVGIYVIVSKALFGEFDKSLVAASVVGILAMAIISALP